MQSITQNFTTFEITIAAIVFCLLSALGIFWWRRSGRMPANKKISDITPDAANHDETIDATSSAPKNDQTTPPQAPPQTPQPRG